MFESFYERVGHLLAEAKWRQQSEDVCGCASREDVVGEEQVGAHVLMRNVEFDAYHESATANIYDMLLCLLKFLKFI